MPTNFKFPPLTAKNKWVLTHCSSAIVFPSVSLCCSSSSMYLACLTVVCVVGHWNIYGFICLLIAVSWKDLFLNCSVCVSFPTGSSYPPSSIQSLSVCSLLEEVSLRDCLLSWHHGTLLTSSTSVLSQNCICVASVHLCHKLISQTDEQTTPRVLYYS